MIERTEAEIKRKIDHAVRTVAELLGVADSETRPQQELLTEISVKDTQSQALIADYANAANEWIWYSKDLEESGKLGYDDAKIAAKLNSLSSKRDAAHEALLGHINNVLSKP